MITLIGESRFPINYSPDGETVVGLIDEPRYKSFIQRLSGRGVILHSIRNPKMRRRFVVNGQVINPSLESSFESPIGGWTYPSNAYEKYFNNVSCRGITLKGNRSPVFHPMLVLSQIEEYEADALQKFANVPKRRGEVKNGLDVILQFIQNIGVEIIERKNFNNTNTALTLKYSRADRREFQVLVSPDGHLLEANLCYSTDDNLYLSEFIMNVGRNGLAAVYGRRW